MCQYQEKNTIARELISFLPVIMTEKTTLFQS